MVLDFDEDRLVQITPIMPAFNRSLKSRFRGAVLVYSATNIFQCWTKCLLWQSYYYNSLCNLTAFIFTIGPLVP